MWDYHKGVVLDFTRPDTLTDCGYIESFNGKFRGECLNTHWLISITAALSLQPGKLQFSVGGGRCAR
ncbi:integrase core domain-containing protein [Pseudochrobactrum asaccharolyticum]|uniref:integrase core domain-containing protein n=1 Tax=Pseudochrobactrum asaccharolyticum TaxID=354351 RepID=UPI003C6E08B6